MRCAGSRLSVLIAWSCFAALNAQSAKPAFEVASVKRNVSNELIGYLTVQPGGRLVATWQTARQLIQFACGISEPQLIDGPEWMRQTRFNVSAKAASVDASLPELRQMLQTLLETRFRLVIASEQREMTVQEIVRSRDDGKLGSRMVEVESQAECAPARARMPRYESQRGTGALVASVTQCGSPDQILPDMVYKQLRAVGVDRTGLTGIWLASVVFKPEGPSNPANIDVGDNAPSFATALQEQLGVKLRQVRSAVPVLSVKSIEMPTDD